MPKPSARRAPRDHQRIFGPYDSRSHHGVDIDVELRVLGQPAQPLVQHLQALLRNLVRLDVIDADLEMVQPARLSLWIRFGVQQIPVGNQRRDDACDREYGGR